MYSDPPTRKWFGHVLTRCSLNRQSGGQRRRWELNPLKTGLQPVAVAVWLQRPKIKCPRQELNLVFDLRRVACDPAHSEDKLAGSHEQDSALGLLSQASVPRSLPSASPLLQRPASVHRMASLGSSLP